MLSCEGHIYSNVCLVSFWRVSTVLADPEPPVFVAHATRVRAGLQAAKRVILPALGKPPTASAAADSALSSCIDAASHEATSDCDASAVGPGVGSEKDNQGGETVVAQVRHVAGMVLAGGIAGCAMWGTVLPIDSAKTRIQTATAGSAADVGLWRTLARMWHEGGVRCWWAGLTPTLIRAFPANAAQWVVWELSTSLLRGV